MVDTEDKGSLLFLKLGTAVQFILYGIYVEMFGICIWILFTRKERRYYCLSAGIIVLFALCSADIALTTAYDAYDMLPPKRSESHQTRLLKDAHFWIVLASNGTADAILLLRCYVVWGRRWKVVIAPICAFIGSHAAASVVMDTSTDTLLPSSLAGTTALNNILLSSLIAFRLYKMSRNARDYLGRKPKNMYNTLIVITLESGILYAALLFFILGMTLDNYSVDSKVIDLCIRSWSVIAAMMPTIIVVRVALGISLDAEQSSMESVHTARDSDSECSTCTRVRSLATSSPL